MFVCPTRGWNFVMFCMEVEGWLRYRWRRNIAQRLLQGTPPLGAQNARGVAKSNDVMFAYLIYWCVSCMTRLEICNSYTTQHSQQNSSLLQNYLRTHKICLVHSYNSRNNNNVINYGHSILRQSLHKYVYCRNNSTMLNCATFIYSTCTTLGIAPLHKAKYYNNSIFSGPLCSRHKLPVVWPYSDGGQSLGIPEMPRVKFFDQNAGVLFLFRQLNLRHFQYIVFNNFCT